MIPAELARRLFRDQCRHNDLSAYGEKAAVAAMVPLIEALTTISTLHPAHDPGFGETPSLADFGFNADDYARHMQQVAIAGIGDIARAALTPQPEEVA